MQAINVIVCIGVQSHALFALTGEFRIAHEALTRYLGLICCTRTLLLPITLAGQTSVPQLHLFC